MCSIATMDFLSWEIGTEHKMNSAVAKPSLGTPMSQCSTAPGTPAANFTMSDPFSINEGTFERLTTPSETVPLLELGVFSSLQNMNKIDEVTVVSFGCPPMSSELGKWAQWSNDTEAVNLIQDVLPISCADYPVLQSELGKIVQWEIKHIQWHQLYHEQAPHLCASEDDVPADTD